MTEDEARKLAQRCIDTWPAGPKAYVWRDALIELDANYAAAAYRRCATSYEKLTVKQFADEYRIISRPIAAEPVERSQPAPYPQRPAAPTISLTEYLERVTQRAVRGDEDASAELDRWQRYLGPAGAKRELCGHNPKENP